jgi:hypothetical protein
LGTHALSGIIEGNLVAPAAVRRLSISRSALYRILANENLLAG